jgi:hypothetical protein
VRVARNPSTMRRNMGDGSPMFRKSLPHGFGHSLVTAIAVRSFYRDANGWSDVFTIAALTEIISVSRTPLLFVSGWGCRGRRLSTALENPDTRPWPWRCHLASHKRGRSGAFAMTNEGRFHVPLFLFGLFLQVQYGLKRDFACVFSESWYGLCQPKNAMHRLRLAEFHRA